MTRLYQSGGCQCEHIRYLAPRTPIELCVCHCTECRKQSSYDTIGLGGNVVIVT